MCECLCRAVYALVSALSVGVPQLLVSTAEHTLDVVELLGTQQEGLDAFLAFDSDAEKDASTVMIARELVEQLSTLRPAVADAVEMHRVLAASLSSTAATPTAAPAAAAAGDPVAQLHAEYSQYMQDNGIQSMHLSACDTPHYYATGGACLALLCAWHCCVCV